MTNALKSRPAAMEKNERHNRLVAIECVEVDRHGETWRFRCDCGRTTEARTFNVRANKTKSCGCLHKIRGCFVSAEASARNSQITLRRFSWEV